MHRPLSAAAVLLLIAGCAGPPMPDLSPRARDAQPAPAPAPDRAPVAPRTDSLRPRGDGGAILTPVARIGDDRIAEGSGLAYAGGWWWTHNDSGDGPFLFRSRSPWFETAERIQVPGARAVDWEELTTLGDDLLVCDIGDNRRSRDDLVLYRVRPTAAGVETVATYPVAYPDGRHDAEGVWVWDGQVHIVLKNRGEEAHWVYRFDELQDGVQNVPQRIGAVVIPAGEQVTAADANADGKVALLTYSQLLIWPADAVRGAPEQTFTLHARQCEALAWTDTGVIFTNEQRDVFFVDRPLTSGLDPWLPPKPRVRLPRVPLGEGGAAARDLLGDVPVGNLRDGESVRMGVVRDRIVLDMTLQPEGEVLPTEGARIGTSVLLAFGTRPRLRVTPDEPLLAIALDAAGGRGAVAMDLGTGRSKVDAGSVAVESTRTGGVVTLHVEIPVTALFPAGLPPRFRLALVGNGLRKGDDEPLLGALDFYSLLRPYAWAEVDVD